MSPRNTVTIWINPRDRYLLKIEAAKNEKEMAEMISIIIQYYLKNNQHGDGRQTG